MTIGAEEFGKLVSTKLPKPPEQPETVFTVALARHQPKTNEHEIRDALIERFLVHGALSDELLDQAIAGHQPVPYLVQRENLERARDFVLEGRHLAVISEFGNGKSIFVRSLASLLALNHIDVYELVDAEDDYLADLRSLAEAGGRCVVVLDDYDRCVEAIEYMTTFSPPGLTLVVASRTSNHERLKPRLEHFGFGYVEFAIDTLSEAEAEGVVDIFDNVGFWGDLAALPRERKRSKILNECRGHISSVLLDIFETSQMRQRVSKLLEPLLTNAEYKSTLFAISLLQTLGIPPTGSLISRIALNDSILESSLRTNDSFVELCNFRGGVVRSRSSLFGTSLIRNNFSAGYIVDRILAFLGSFGDGRGDAPNIQQIVKELMRFKNIEALLPERNRRDNLLRFYELLKREVPWQAYEPHYWVQYAMALLTFSEFDRAQQLLDTAYSLAEKRIGYHTVNIDTQQARLHLLRCLSSTSGPEALRSFNAGHRVLMGVPDDMGKWRQIDRYEEIYRLKYPLFSNGGKVEFEHACKAVLASISNAISKGGLTPRAEYLTNVIKKELGSILDGIRQSRS